MTLDVDRVRDVAAAQLEGDPDGGAALCVIVDGVEILSETWGLADASTGAPYTGDTLQIVQSMGKGVIAAAAALLVGRGQLDPQQRVAWYWPEFGSADKRDITVSQLFSHQSGLVYLDGGMPLELTADRERLAAALVAQSPAWEPGTKVGYSPQTFGNYADFLFERACGRGFADLLGELTAGLQIELYVGLPAGQRHRAARALAGLQESMVDLSPQLTAALADPDSLLMRVMRNIPGSLPDPMPLVNGDAIRDAFMPAANMFAGAPAFARLYDALAGVLRGATSPLWTRPVIEEATREVVRGADAVTMLDMAFATGFQKPSATYPFARSPRAFGHGGAGGSLAMTDPDAGFAMCWIPTRYATAPFDARQVAVVDAIYEGLN